MSILSNSRKLSEQNRTQNLTKANPAVAEVIRMLETSDLQTAVQTLVDKYAATLTLWYEPTGYKIIWEHECIRDQNVSGNRLMHMKFYTLLQASHSPNLFVFIIGYLGKTDNYLFQIGKVEAVMSS